jgi:transcriptional regulator of aromatic amino acid metabolism
MQEVKYAWPGNVKALQMVNHRAAAMVMGDVRDPVDLNLLDHEFARVAAMVAPEGAAELVTDQCGFQSMLIDEFEWRI